MFEKLKGFVGDNSEALALVEMLEGNTASNVKKINDLEREHERKVTDVTETRDKYKAGNALVKSILGVDTVNEETITEAIKALRGGKGDEKLLAEIENLKGLLKKATGDNESLKLDYDSKLQTMAFENDLANSGLGADVANEAMYKIVAELARKDATSVDNTVVYKNKDGTTIYGKDNTPLTLGGRIKDIKSDANYAGLFKIDVNSGTGTPPHNKGASQQTNEMSPSQKMAAGRKQ